MATRWIGDLRSCFLLDDGWAFRVKVNSFQLNGKSGWQLPLSVGAALGLEAWQTISLPFADVTVPHELTIERRDTTCVGSEISAPLHRLRCRENDLAFLTFRQEGYNVVVRRQEEVDDDDPLGALLWHCGLDPADPTVRSSPWTRLARTLGGTGDRPELVLERLQRRGDRSLAVLVEGAIDVHRHADSRSRWPGMWQYVMPDHDDTDRLCLQRGDGEVRVALGVVDGTAEPPRDLTLSDGGIIWLGRSPADDMPDVERLLDAPPAGLVPSASRLPWVRWMRADHAGRRAALFGNRWRVDRTSEGWWHEGRCVDDLGNVLLSLRPSSGAVALEPSRRVRLAYPRHGLAFARQVEAAVRSGLSALEGEVGIGYRAIYGDGADVLGATLIDVLSR